MLNYINSVQNNLFILVVAIVIFMDTFLGVLRAIKQRKFNSCFCAKYFALMLLNIIPHFFKRHNAHLCINYIKCNMFLSICYLHFFAFLIIFNKKAPISNKGFAVNPLF